MDFSDVHIVFCDHDKQTGSGTLSLLQKCCYRVTAVKSAREVVEALQSEDADVDIVLTDVELPQEKGFKMLKHILRRENLGHIAVVVMSEHDEMAVVAKCLLLGAADYLVKPLRLNEVMNLWTHMWRKRRVMGLPDKNVGVESMGPSRKPATTADLLSGYQNVERSPVVSDTFHASRPGYDTSPQLELSLRLSLDYTAEKLCGQPDVASLPSQASPANGRVSHPSAFSVYCKSSNSQPDEQSGTNVCSPCSSRSKRSINSNKRAAWETQESVGGVAADHASVSSLKDASMADETRSGDMESQICDKPDQFPMDQDPTPCITAGNRSHHAEQTSPTNAQGFQACHAYVRSSPLHMEQGVVAPNVQEATTLGYMNTLFNPSHMQQLPPYCHEGGMANVSTVPNIYTYYPVAHLAVPVVNFSSWPAVVTSPPLVGGKLIQAERREAALSKFRMKRKGRCFEKKIRYASRKKLAEQRPRVRGQFVKRSVLANNTCIEVVSDEEGEADDEQGCSELDNNSSPDCTSENQRVG